MKDTRAQIVVIDDHRVVGLGVKAAFEAQCADASISWYPTVPDAPWEHGQVAVLDLRLADGSAPDENIADINGRGVPVVVYTSGDDPYLVRRAIAGGALSIVRKSAPPEDLVEAVLAASDGATCPTPDWAAALDADEDFVASRLSDLEARILAHYASGERSGSVARALNVSKNTVNTYIARIREKYRESGRPAESRVDLFRRAAEDGLLSYFD
ncbi:DNA-binding response regulator [Pauljensenia hongkongensis]|jgi:response regulator receiver|uniref:Transcriptional regulator n=1 Tax=Pauljensenia hongkongensis TaxID=178339 RepID=A0A1D8B1M8_9ACTO|nr:response regulator transcription factor [Pauljensenia hongkongensis]AOS47033.1 transcriptional regulator [Pauljensenia hongkongensis]EFW10271.1 two component system response regulator [Actinomyces sp. oral taxon 178 str. F0338]RKV66822.1 MAG: DNA-binding response regulator [Actinomyces sp.]